MKFGVRKRSYKKSFKARTTGKLKRKVKKATNPFYGKKGMGMIRNPRKSIYNKVYRRTTIDSRILLGGGSGRKRRTSSSSKSYHKQRISSASKSYRGSTPVATSSSLSFKDLLTFAAFVLLLALLLAWGAIIVPIAIVVAIGAIVIKHIWSSKRYSQEQVERLKAIIAPHYNNPYDSKQMVQLVRWYTSSTKSEIEQATSVMSETNSVAEFVENLKAYLSARSGLDAVSAIIAEPSEYTPSSTEPVEKMECDFISRTFSAEIKSASALKTERGKQNRYKKYFSSLSPYEQFLCEPAIQQIERLKSKYLGLSSDCDWLLNQARGDLILTLESMISGKE